MDLSADFISICKVNAKQENVKVNFIEGNVSDMPFPENTFDFIICSAAFKNFKDPVKAINEMYRVLNTNGIALIIDMNRIVSKQVLNDEAKKASKGFFEYIFMKNVFKILKKGAYSKEEFIEILQDCNFSNNEIKEVGLELKVYLYKS